MGGFRFVDSIAEIELKDGTRFCVEKHVYTERRKREEKLFLVQGNFSGKVVEIRNFVYNFLERRIIIEFPPESGIKKQTIPLDVFNVVELKIH